MTAAQRSTYHAECLCGKAIVSFEVETICEACGRWLVFEWGNEPVVVAGMKGSSHIQPETSVKAPEKAKAMGAGA